MKKTLLAVLAMTTASAFAAPTIKECIAPSDPGGGWDFTCRSVSNVLLEEKYVDKAVQTVNMAGAGGGVAFAHVVSKRKNDDGVFIAASTATTTRLAQGQFRNMNADMVRWVGSLGADYGVIAVSAKSEYADLTALIDALKKDPKSVKFAGASSKGGWDHLKVLLTARAAGLTDYNTIPYLSFNNGGDAITQVVGGHLDAFTGDISEVQGFVQSGDLKVLAVLSDERLPEPYQNIATGKEQGVDFIAPNWRGFYLPGGVSDDTYQWWVDTLDKLGKTDAWKDVMNKNGLLPFHKTGAEMEEYVKAQIGEIEAISKEIGIIK